MKGGRRIERDVAANLVEREEKKSGKDGKEHL